MYIHQADWDAAMRVAEQHEPASIGTVQEAWARQKESQKDYAGAEQLFVQSKKFELAVNMYKTAGLWDDALRVAKKFATKLVATLQQERMNTVASSNPQAAEGVDFLMQQAKLLESQKKYSPAIDTYLKITKNHTTDFNTLERAWEAAVTVAMEHFTARVNEVVDEVGRRFLDLRRFDEAAELQLGVDNFKAAIDAYLAGGKYEKARELAQLQAPQLLSYVENNYQGNLAKENKMSELGDRNPDAAIEMLVKRDEWDKVFEIANKQGKDVVNKYASIQAKKTYRRKEDKASAGGLLQARRALCAGQFRRLQPLGPGNFEPD